MDIRPISIDDIRNAEVYHNMMLSVYRMLLLDKLKKWIPTGSIAQLNIGCQPNRCAWKRMDMELLHIPWISRKEDKYKQGIRKRTDMNIPL
jgi:hypothetical protein